MPNTQPIGTVLARRRKELGLTIEKVSTDTKLRPHVIEAFEYTDFDAMPPKGYARASIGSYARYLGLSTTEVLRAYDEQLAEYEARQSGYAVQDRDRRREPSWPDERASQGRTRTPSQRTAASAHRNAEPSYGRAQRTGGYGADQARRAGRDDYGRAPDRPQTEAPRREEGRPASGRRRETVGPTSGAYGSRPEWDAYPQRGRASARASSLDSRRGDLYGTPQARRTAAGARPRQTAEPIEVDSGYEGGSGGRTGGRNQTTRSTQQSLSEVLWGVVDAIRSDRRTMLLFVAVLAVVLVVVVAVAVSSCMSKPAETSGSSSIPVTSVSAGTAQQTQPSTVVDTTKLNPSGIDLSAVPVNAKVALALAADATSEVWAEVNVDGNAVYADKLQPGATLEWTMGQSLAVTLSDMTGVSLTINDTQVTPTISNGTYVLNAAVPQDQWVQEPAADTSQGDPDDGTAQPDDGSDYSDYSDYSDETDYSDYSDEGQY